MFAARTVLLFQISSKICALQDCISLRLMRFRNGGLWVRTFLWLIDSALKNAVYHTQLADNFTESLMIVDDFLK